MKKAKIRIMLADDHMLMRMGLSTLVACEEDMKIVGEARNGRQAVDGDAPGRNEDFRMATGAEAGIGQGFLEADGHGTRRRRQMAVIRR